MGVRLGDVRFCLAAALPLCLALSSTSIAYVFTTLDVPGAINVSPAHGTRAVGVSGSMVVGYYQDSAAKYHGFLYDGSTYTTLDDPLGTKGTFANGISGTTIVGDYDDSAGVDHGFIYNGSTFTTFDFPSATQTRINSISGSLIVGQYFDGSQQHGFSYDGSTYTTLDDPLAPNGTVAYGTDGSAIVGDFFTYGANGNNGFRKDNSAYSTVNFGANPTIATGVSGNVVVGYYSVSGRDHGFIFNGSTYSTLDDPIAFHTNPYGMAGSTVVGAFTDNSNSQHGFITTVPEPSSLLFVLLTFAAFVIRRKSRNPAIL